MWKKKTITEKIFVSNITKDEVMLFDDVMKDYPDYLKNPLHHLTCDKGFEKDKPTEFQVGFIVTEKQVQQIKSEGYCTVVCEYIDDFLVLGTPGTGRGRGRGNFTISEDSQGGLR